MSILRADSLRDRAGTGAPELTFGATVPTGRSISGAGGINITGVCTATSFRGDGSLLTGISASGDGGFVRTSVGIHTLGNVGFGTTNPTSRFTVTGDGLVTGIVTAANFNSSSDINLKENIVKIEGALDKVSNLNGVYFDWKATKEKSIGVIAQEVEEVFPEVIGIDGNNNKTVGYGNLVAVLIEAIKELRTEVDELKSIVGK